MLHDNTINNVLEGGPAHLSGRLARGDVIVAVDGNDVTADSAAEALVGCDTPGSFVALTVQRTHQGDTVRAHPVQVGRCCLLTLEVDNLLQQKQRCLI